MGPPKEFLMIPDAVLEHHSGRIMDYHSQIQVAETKHPKGSD